MTTTQILDALAPYTPEEKRCGYKKKRKIDLRYRLLLEIEKMQRDGLRNDDILNYLHADKQRV